MPERPPTPAGEMLIEEFLRPMGMTQRAAAQRMGMPLNRLNELIRGKRGVTADTALSLAALLGTTPEFWMNLQAGVDLHEAARRREKAQQRLLLSSWFEVNGGATKLTIGRPLGGSPNAMIRAKPLP